MEYSNENDIKIGDRVLCKHYGVLATVDHFGVHEGKKTYIVKHDKPQRLIGGKTFTYQEYSRYGITKNYDNNGKQIVGNAAYYREELMADYWGDGPMEFEFDTLHGDTRVQVWKPANDGSEHGDRWKTVITVGEDVISNVPEETTTTYRKLDHLCEHLAELYDCAHIKKGE